LVDEGHEIVFVTDQERGCLIITMEKDQAEIGEDRQQPLIESGQGQRLCLVSGNRDVMVKGCLLAADTQGRLELASVADRQLRSRLFRKNAAPDLEQQILQWGIFAPAAFVARLLDRSCAEHVAFCDAQLRRHFAVA